MQIGQRCDNVVSKPKKERFYKMRKPIVLAVVIVLMLAFVTSVQASPEVGDVIPFGGYDWRVLDVQNNKALIITENVIERIPYDVKYKAVTWETCTIREYLNGEFLQKFTAEEQRHIAETRVSNPDNLWYGTNGGNDTTDKVFLLSLEELVEYFGDSGQLQNRPANSSLIDDQYNTARKAMDTSGTVSWWWLRSPGLLSNGAAGVNDGGGVYVFGVGVSLDDGGVRPALWMNL